MKDLSGMNVDTMEEEETPDDVECREFLHRKDWLLCFKMWVKNFLQTGHCVCMVKSNVVVNVTNGVACCDSIVVEPTIKR